MARRLGRSRRVVRLAEELADLRVCIQIHIGICSGAMSRYEEEDKEYAVEDMDPWEFGHHGGG